ncbi:MAG TPA: ImmA/IrrE family metallo-endopeptidase [Candidatus Saccharimonadales bacterium]|nr:ImmA/IrrE family metallo-endopeptidase [Candidatus Saccharimonadales bacterium]
MKLTHVRALAEEYALKFNPKNLAPFPYENVTAEHKDLRVYFTSLDDDEVSGAILYKDGKFNILVNNTKPLQRQHFTVAHEIGHYFLHQDILKGEHAIVDGEDALDGAKILYRNDDNKTKQLEIEANNFAASLIMPADLVRRAWEATHSIQECARIFSVSVVAMSVRLTNLGLVGG